MGRNWRCTITVEPSTKREGLAHIYPIEDIKEHIESCLCPCIPTYIIKDQGWIVVHNAFDRRDEIERVFEEIKIQGNA